MKILENRKMSCKVSGHSNNFLLWFAMIHAGLDSWDEDVSTELSSSSAGLCKAERSAGCTLDAWTTTGLTKREAEVTPVLHFLFLFAGHAFICRRLWFCELYFWSGGAATLATMFGVHAGPGPAVIGDHETMDASASIFALSWSCALARFLAQTGWHSMSICQYDLHLMLCEYSVFHGTMVHSQPFPLSTFCRPWIFAMISCCHVACAPCHVGCGCALQGDPTCWLGEITYETCCLPPPHGNPQCWDATYTFQRCCREVEAAVDINAVEEISDLGGCELNIFQEFKLRAGAWYRNGTPNLVLFQEFGYISRRFDSMYRTDRSSCVRRY